jgi:hypothetical protein
VNEDMSALAALASVTCGHLLAAGYDADIFSWLPFAANFGKPLEPDFVFSYDEPVGFTEEITEAFPDYHQESLDIWSKELFDLCQRKEYETLSFPWKSSAVPARSAIHEMRPVSLKAGMTPTELMSLGKAPIRPAPQKIKTGSDPGGGELLLNLAITAGAASGWYEVICKELQDPRPTFQRSFFAAC